MSSSRHLEPVPGSNGRTDLVTPPTSLRRLTSIPAASPPDREISARFVWNVFSQWWRVIIPAALLMATASVVCIMLTFTPLYRSSAWLEISENSPYVVFPDQQQARRFVETQMELMRSPLILNALMKHPEIAKMPELARREDPVSWLMKKLEIAPIGNSEYVEIAFAGPDPSASAELVNGIVDEFFKVRHRKKSERTVELIKLLQSEEYRHQQEVKRLREQVRAVGKTLPELPTHAGGNVIITSNPLQDLHQQLMETEVRVQTLEAQVQALDASLRADVLVLPEAMVTAHVDAAPDVQELRVLIQQKRAMLPRIEVSSRLGVRDPSYQRIDNEITRLEATLEASRQNNRPRIVEQVQASDQLQRQSQLLMLKTDLEGQRQLQAALQRKYDERRAELSENGDARMEFEFATQELERATQVVNMIAERVTQMETELAAPSRTELLQAASPPPTPVEKYPLTLLAGALVGSFCIPFGVALLWENSIRRITSAEQLEAQTEIGVIGEISRLPARRSLTARGPRATATQEMRLFEESIDGVRTGLVLANEQQEIQVLAVASAVSGEGKTSVASQLAVSIARATGHQVLLIDADLRSPDIHQIFDVQLAPGLAEVLSHECSLDEAINRTWSEHIHLLPAGQLTKNPHKLLGSDTFRALLEEARLWYRYIVIDTPPILAASESLVIAREADSTLLCAMRDFSREHHVRLAHRRLRSTGARAVGAVLNGVPVRSFSYRYGGYGTYGSARR